MLFNGMSMSMGTIKYALLPKSAFADTGMLD